MNDIKRRYRKLWILLWAMAGIGTEGIAQPLERELPLAGIPLLSGSFGELRGTHFHTGVDFRTGGRIGLPVLCVNDGMVARIKVSAGGYGQALYIEHPDGLTSVYAHLERFHPRIEKVVRTLQYREECFEVDEDTKKYHLFFHKGDTIAWSGNTGSSGGPHLHFEYRNTLTEMALDPLYYIQVRDQIAPVFQALYIYRMDRQGREERVGQAVPKAEARNHYRAEAVRIPAGKIGLGVWITDAMNGSWSKLGIHTLVVTVNGETVYDWTINRLSFDQVDLIHAVKDFNLYAEGKTVYRCFGRVQRELTGVRMVGDGCIALAKGEQKTVEIQTTDRNGNRSRLRFQLTGLPPLAPKSKPVLQPGRSYRLAAGEYVLELDSTALFSAVDSVTYCNSSGRFVVSGTVHPLRTRGVLRVFGVSDTRTLIGRLTEKGKTEVFRTFRDSAGIYALVGVLGTFTQVRDAIPPEIEYAGVSGGSVRFRIRDACSGIRNYRVEANGAWMLFEYDAKTATLSGALRDPRIKKGANTLVVLVTDYAGNRAEKRIRVEM